MYKQYQIIELVRDLNPIIKAGMKGVILDIWDENGYEVEFLDDEGYNFEYNGEYTFTLSKSDFRSVS